MKDAVLFLTRKTEVSLSMLYMQILFGHRRESRAYVLAASVTVCGLADNRHQSHFVEMCVFLSPLEEGGCKICV